MIFLFVEFFASLSFDVIIAVCLRPFADNFVFLDKAFWDNECAFVLVPVEDKA